ncbi:YbaB/EbfC family nucleoid-associated protein [Chloroflexota bacterium]
MNLSMLNQARELKANLDKTQKELAKTVLEVSTGGGVIKVSINGQQKILSVVISPKVIDPNKPKYLEDLVLKAMNEALDKSQKMAAKNLKGLTGGIKIPGLT